MDLFELIFWGIVALVILIPIVDATRDPSWRAKPLRVYRRR